MEKLAYGLSFLTVLYIVFLYLTTKMLVKDAWHEESSDAKEKFKNEKRDRKDSKSKNKEIDILSK